MSTVTCAPSPATEEVAPDRRQTINERLLRAAEGHLTRARLGTERQRREAITYWQMCLAAVEQEKA